MKNRTAWPVVAGFLVLVGLPAPVPAADGVAEEIVVTARKRQEALQDVPLSIAVLNSAQLQGRGLNSDYDIANFTIGFRTLQQTGRDIDRPVIRGMGAPSTRGEPNASYFIDGTFVSGSISTATTSAVERVEVLRGPQSAQFGRATFSGAVNYVTRSPTDTLQGQLNTRAGTHDDYSAGGWASGPLVGESLYFLVSGNWSHYGGQWNNQLAQGQAFQAPEFPRFLVNAPQDADHSRLGAEETTDLLGKLVWRPAEGTEVSLKYGYTKGEDSHFPSLIHTELNCFLPLPGTESEPWYGTSSGYYCGEWNAEGRVNRINLPDFSQGITYGYPGFNPDNPEDFVIPPTEPGTFREQDRLLLQYVQDLNGFTVTTRASWNRDDFRQLFDLDHTEARTLWGLFHFDNLRDIEDYSAELRLDTPGDWPVRGALGVYWYDQDRTNTQRSYPGPAVAFGAGNTTVAYPPSTFIDVSNRAVFGSIDWDLAERWTLTLEARYAKDEKDLSGGALLAPLPTTVGVDFDSTTPRATLRYKPVDDLTLYALVAKGNKPGDFNTEFFRSSIAESAVDAALNGCVVPLPPAQSPTIPCLAEKLALVKEEEQWTYEIGAKASWLDGRITTNLAMYHIDWENQGLFTTVSILEKAGTRLLTTIIRNIGKSEVDGIELENSFRVTDRLSLAASYGYTDSRYVQGIDPVLAELTGDGSVGGKTVPSVPRHTVILGALLTAPLTTEADAFLNVDYAWNSKRYTAANNFAWIGEEITLNLRAGVEAGAWTFAGYVRNLTDDDTPVASLDFVNFGGVDPNYPLDGNRKLANGTDPRMFSLNPKRGRDFGLEVQYRF